MPNIKRIGRGLIQDQTVDREFDHLVKQVEEEYVSKSEMRGQWYSGAGSPQNSVGKDGDFYFKTSTKEVFIKEKGSWV
jgi:hypothetical protein